MRDRKTIGDEDNITLGWNYFGCHLLLTFPIPAFPPYDVRTLHIRGMSTMPAYSRDARFQIVIDDQNEQNAKFHFLKLSGFAKMIVFQIHTSHAWQKNSKMQSFIFWNCAILIKHVPNAKVQTRIRKAFLQSSIRKALLQSRISKRKVQKQNFEKAKFKSRIQRQHSEAETNNSKAEHETQELKAEFCKAEFKSRMQKRNLRRVQRHHEICIENDVFMKEIIGNPVQDWKRTIQKQNWAAANGDNKREESEHVVFMQEIIGIPTAWAFSQGSSRK